MSIGFAARIPFSEQAVPDACALVDHALHGEGDDKPCCPRKRVDARCGVGWVNHRAIGSGLPGMFRVCSRGIRHQDQSSKTQTNA